MPDETILAGYRKALQLSEKVLDAAQCGKWDELLAAERDYTSAIDEIRLLDLEQSTDLGFMQQKTALIEKILANSQQAQALTQSRMDELQGTISNTHQEIKLNRAYFTNQF